MNPKRVLLSALLGTLALAAPAAAQRAPLVSVQPYAGYAFFGKLPEESAKLNPDLVLGARASLRLAGRLGVFGNFQRSTPKMIGQLPLGFELDGRNVRVDQWSAGLQYAHVPGGVSVEGRLPLVLEAGVGQVRYAGGQNDQALNLGISTGALLGRNLSIQYGFNDFVTHFNGDQGILHQLSVSGGLALRL